MAKDAATYQRFDEVELRKQHACGANRFKITRMVPEVHLECLGCGHTIVLKRAQFESRVVRRLKQAQPELSLGLHIVFVDETGQRLSRMAAALASRLFKDHVTILCAALEPAHELDEAAYAFMQDTYGLALESVDCLRFDTFCDEFMSRMGNHLIVDLCQRPLVTAHNKELCVQRWRISDPCDFGLDAYHAATEALEEQLRGLAQLIARK